MLPLVIHVGALATLMAGTSVVLSLFRAPSKELIGQQVAIAKLKAPATAAQLQRACGLLFMAGAGMA